MSNDTVVSLAAPALVPDPLTELVRSGARRLVEAAVRDAGLAAQLLRIGHLVAGPGRPARRLQVGERGGPANSARRTVDGVHPAMRQLAREGDGVLHRPAAVDPVHARETEREGPILRPLPAHRLRDLEREPHAAAPPAPVAVRAPVADRGVEGMDEIAVRGVYLEEAESRLGHADPDRLAGCLAGVPRLSREPGRDRG